MFVSSARALVSEGLSSRVYNRRLRVVIQVARWESDGSWRGKIKSKDRIEMSAGKKMVISTYTSSQPGQSVPTWPQ